MKGFSLLELLILLAISGIICAFAYPTYRASIIKSNRIEAQMTLQELAGRMEQWYDEHDTYESILLDQHPIVRLVKSDHYHFSIQSATLESYILLATPIGKQGQDDKLCQSLSLEHSGIKRITEGPRGLPEGSVEDCFI